MVYFGVFKHAAVTKVRNCNGQMDSGMLETITHLVTTFGYVIVAAFILLECAGFPVPGETALLVAAGFAGAGKLSIATVIVTATLAGILGNAGGYWLGRLLGRGFVERFGKYVGLNRKRMAALEGFFVKHGSIAVFLAALWACCEPMRPCSRASAGCRTCDLPFLTLLEAFSGRSFSD